MKNNLIKTINFLVVMITGAIVLFGFIFLLLNWPAFLARSKRITDVSKEVEAKELEEANFQIDLPDSDSVRTDKIYPDIFVSAGDLALEEEYINQINEGELMIPSLGIRAPIRYLDTLDEAAMKAKLKEGVVHYPLTAMPGQSGNVFIFGHSSYYWWDWSEYNSIFANLEKISGGEVILIKFSGKLFVYRVTNTKIVESNDLTVLSQGKGQNLTLMTCTPLGTDLQRFIVESELVN